MLKNDIGERIEYLRKSKKLSQNELAKKVGVDRTYISRLECGRQNITIENLNIICLGLGVSLKHFFSTFNDMELSTEAKHD